jgi:hypothetical protein
LFVNHHFADSGQTISVLRAAAARCGLTLDFAGREFGCGSEEAENILPGYDLVFAFGPVAAEALACGCAVVTQGAGGYGEMVGPGNYERLRQENFTLSADTIPVPFAQMEIPLSAYQPDAGSLLAERIRADADFQTAVDQLLEIYHDVIAQHQRAQPNPRAELLATSRYLRNLAPGIMRAHNQPSGLMRPKIVWTPTALPTGKNPQK